MNRLIPLLAMDCAVWKAVQVAQIAEDEATALSSAKAFDRAAARAAVAAAHKAIRKAMTPTIRAWSPPPKRVGSQGRHAAREIGPKELLRR